MAKTKIDFQGSSDDQLGEQLGKGITERIQLGREQSGHLPSVLDCRELAAEQRRNLVDKKAERVGRLPDNVPELLG